MNCGIVFAWPSPSIPKLIANSSEIKITFEEASYFAVIPPVTMSILSVFMAVVVDVIGRRRTIIMMPFFQLLSWIMIYLANSIGMLYAARLVAGIADSMNFITIPTFMAEVSEPKVRGSWGNGLAISLYLGGLLANTIGSYLTIKTAALVFALVPITQMCLVLLVPESPYFLLMKNDVDAARESLQILRWKDDVEEELSRLTKDVERQTSERGTFLDLFTNPINRKGVFIALGARAAQQMSGFSAFTIYTQYLFSQAGSNISSVTSSIILNALLVVCITIAIFFVDKVSRRDLLVISCIGSAIVLSLETCYFYMSDNTSIDTTNFRWLPLVGMLAYIIVFSFGLGTIPTLMLGELFSASIKSKAMCFLIITFSMLVIIVSKVFQFCTYNFGIYVPFLLFTLCCWISAVLCYFFIPDTRGKTLEEIQQLLRGSAKI